MAALTDEDQKVSGAAFDIGGALMLLNPSTVSFMFAGLASTLRSAVQQRATHLAALTYFFFGVGARHTPTSECVELGSSRSDLDSQMVVNNDLTSDSSADRYLAGSGVCADASKPQSGRIRLAWHVTAQEALSAVGIQNNPLKRVREAEVDSKSSSTADMKLPARVLDFLAKLSHSDELHHVEAGFNVQVFPRGKNLVACLHALLGQVRRPERELVSCLGVQLPMLSRVFRRIVSTDDVTWFRGHSLLSVSPSSTVGSPTPSIEHVELRCPMPFALWEKHYADILPFLRRLALVHVRITDQNDDLQLASLRYAQGTDGQSGELCIEAAKQGTHAVWCRTATCLPVSPLRSFSFDLTSEEDLFARVVLKASFLGVAISLPSMVLRLTSTVRKGSESHAPGLFGSETCVTIASIEPTTLTVMGLFVLGLSNIFQVLQASFSLVFCLDPHAATEQAQLSAQFALDVPHSSLLSAYTWRRMKDYTTRWLGLLTLLADIFEAAQTDLVALFAL